MNVLTKIFSDTILVGKVLVAAATSRIYLLMMATVVMYRSTAHKVLPAMYIENVTQLAFDDISAEDQDFAFIQGQTLILVYSVKIEFSCELLSCTFASVMWLELLQSVC
jgi:hypothetical protein